MENQQRRVEPSDPTKVTLMLQPVDMTYVEEPYKHSSPPPPDEREKR